MKMLNRTFDSKAKNDPRFSGKSAVIFLILSFMMTFIFYSCKKDENTTNAPQQPACNQACKDDNTAYGLIDVFWFIWNQNIAGQTVGTKDFTVAGPQGGTVHVTGPTDHSNNGVNTLHLTLELTNCKGIKSKYNLTFNGTVTADGTFDNTYKAITYASQQLDYVGTVGYDYWLTNVSGTCNITFNETQNSVSGTFCDRTFSY